MVLQKWNEDAAALRAWQKGRTGFPLVDAGMRQLWQTGWMQQSIRMVCAAFLTEYLNVHWVQGCRSACFSLHNGVTVTIPFIHRVQQEGAL